MLESLLRFYLNWLLRETTRLSNEGQVSISTALRAAHHWEAGQELIAIDQRDELLLKLKNPF